MLRQKWTASLLMGCLLLLSVPVFVEEGKTEEGFESYSLGEVYIKGDKPPVVKEVAVTNVITANDITATNSKTVAEALSNVPGMRVTSGTKNEPNISIHGVFDQSRILVMIDGVPYYETKYGKLDLNQFSTSNVAKIEVTKGAASVLYGANAMGGVINIITKKAIGKPTYEVNLEGGEVDYYKASASHGMSTDRFYYWLNYEHSQAHGWGMSDDFSPRLTTVTPSKPASPYQTVVEDGGTRNQSDFRTDSIWAKFGITPTKDSDYSINFHYVNRDKGNPPSIDSVKVFTNTPAFSNFFRYPSYNDWGIDLNAEQKPTNWMTCKAKLFYHSHVDELQSYSDKTFMKSIALSKYQDYIVGGTLITEFKPVEWNTVRLSFNYKGDSHKQRDDLNYPFENFFSFTGSAGIENEITLWKNFSIVVGGSYDWFKVTDANRNLSAVKQVALTTKATANSFNPMIGANYIFPDSTKLFATVARKTRFPTLSNLFDSKAGNPDLKTECAVNSTIGVSRSFGNFAWGELSFFYHDISDLIDKSGPNKTDKYVNLGKVELYGIELNAEFYPAKDLVLRLGYNFNHASDQSEPASWPKGDKKTDKVRNAPEHKLDIGFQYTIPFIKSRIDLNGILFSSYYSQLPTISSPTNPEKEVSGYFVMNARLSKKFSDNWEAYVAINNIFDRNYEPEIGFPAQGRNIFGGITAKF